jgi:hypothetical protein
MDLKITQKGSLKIQKFQYFQNIYLNTTDSTLSIVKYGINCSLYMNFQAENIKNYQEDSVPGKNGQNSQF